MRPSVKVLLVALAFMSFDLPAAGPSLRDRCGITLEKVGWKKIRGVPAAFRHIETLEGNRSFLSQFKNWKYQNGAWTSSDYIPSLSVIREMPNAKFVKVQIRIEPDDYRMVFWMMTSHDMDSIVNRIRWIVYARALFSRLYPDARVPFFRGQTSGMNGVALTGLGLTQDSFRYLELLLRQVKFYPSEAKFTFENMTESEQNDGERWFVGQYDQSSNSRERTIWFAEILRDNAEHEGFGD
jgi:hypothetical protein